MSWGLQKCQGQQKGAFKIVLRERKPPNQGWQFYVNGWQSAKQIAQLFVKENDYQTKKDRTNIDLRELGVKKSGEIIRHYLAFQMQLGLLARWIKPQGLTHEI